MHKLVHFGSYYSPLHYDYIIFHDKIDRPFRFICPINRPAFNEEKEPVGCNGGEIEYVIVVDRSLRPTGLLARRGCQVSLYLQ